METHLRPLKISQGKYLFTSPEFYLKEILLSHSRQDLKNGIFTFAYSFRNDPKSPIHRQCFLMLEWYLLDKNLAQLGDFVQHLIPGNPKLEEMTMQQCMLKYCGIDFYKVQTAAAWKNILEEKFPYLISQIKTDLTWDDYFHLLFLNEVEPHFKNHPYLLIKDYPAQCRALAKLSTKDDEPTAKRMELFVNGVEIGNGYEESTTLEDYQKIYEKVLKEKAEIYSDVLEASCGELSFFKALKEKDLPDCSGMAIGVERLFQELNNNHYFSSRF